MNTNAAYLAEKLAGAGLDCYYQTVVGDNVERLAGVLKCAMERSECDPVIWWTGTHGG